ncbi:DUF975 family protein, partial [Streptococcus pasteurianus]
NELSLKKHFIKIVQKSVAFSCLQFSFIGWYILTGITCGLLYFYTLPYITTANLFFYEDLLENAE